MSEESPGGNNRQNICGIANILATKAALDRASGYEKLMKKRAVLGDLVESGWNSNSRPGTDV
jgi:hypothetical protein